MEEELTLLNLFYSGENMTLEEVWRYAKEAPPTTRGASCEIFCESIGEGSSDCVERCVESDEVTITLSNGTVLGIPAFALKLVKKLLKEGRLERGSMIPVNVLMNGEIVYYLVVKEYFEDGSLFVDVVRERREHLFVVDPL